jgi:hypothetical protein
VQNLWLYAISAYAGELCKDNTSWCSGDVGFTLLDISLAFYWYYLFPECNRSAIGVSLSYYLYAFHQVADAASKDMERSSG